MGALQDFESVITFKKFLNSLGSVFLGFEGFREQNIFDLRSMYLLDPRLNETSKWFLQIILFGVNLRMESPLLYFNLQRKVKKKKISVFSLGAAYSNFKETLRDIGVVSTSFLELIEARLLYSRIIFKSIVFSRLYFVLNYIYSTHSFGFRVLEFFFYKVTGIINSSEGTSFFNIKEDLGCIGVLQRYVGLIVLAELGYNFIDMQDILSDGVNQDVEEPTGIGFFLGTVFSNIKEKVFAVLLGSWGQENNHELDLVLPGVSFLEQEATFMNFAGKKVSKNKIMADNFGLKKIPEIICNLVDYVHSYLLLNISCFKGKGVFTYIHDIVGSKVSKMSNYLKGLAGFYLPSSASFTYDFWSGPRIREGLDRFIRKDYKVLNINSTFFSFLGAAVYL